MLKSLFRTFQPQPLDNRFAGVSGAGTAKSTGIEWFELKSNKLTAIVHVARFAPPGAVEEYHLNIRPRQYGSVADQIKAIEQTYEIARSELDLPRGTAILRRFFCSDVVNQAPILDASPIAHRGTAVGGGGKNGDSESEDCAVSWIGQSPVPDAKVTMRAFHLRRPSGGTGGIQHGGSKGFHRGPLTHHWLTGLIAPEKKSSYDQTEEIFRQYNRWLEKLGLTLADNVIRTWLFVKNIDADYEGLVVARREYFATHGLTPETHYIASSGIQGECDDVRALVSMDAYAIEGVKPEQLQFLNALDYLGPTDAYGVTFERATSVGYRDRKHVYISGTASINPEGEILHIGDVGQQLDRTLENIDSLIADAGGGLSDLAYLTVYLRDASDHGLIDSMLRERFPAMPLVIVIGPVCRPGWLIELEGVALISHHDLKLPGY